MVTLFQKAKQVHLIATEPARHTCFWKVTTYWTSEKEKPKLSKLKTKVVLKVQVPAKLDLQSPISG